MFNAKTLKLSILSIIASFVYSACIFAVAQPVNAAEANAKVQQAKKVQPGIPVIGKSADGKYPVYKLEGDLTDINYFSGNTSWQSGDLLTRMVFLEPQDVNHGKYFCEFICKDGFQNVVGINPSFKKLLKH
jgi:hypothetical protein